MSIKGNNYDDFLAGIDRLNRDRTKREEQYLEGITAVSGGAETSEEMEPMGDRIKRIRETKSLTLEDVASRTGFGPDYLAKIEANDFSPPLGVLIKLGKALDMKLGYFISGGETRPYTVVRADDRTKVSRRAASTDKAYGYTFQSLAPNKTDRHMEPFMVTLEPTENVELSSHEGQEFIFVMDGTMEAILDQDKILLGPGDSIYYDSNIPHLVRCVDGPFAKILAVLYAYDK